VAAAFGTSRHIVEIIGALDLEWNVAAALHEGEVAARVGDFREVDELAG
jgi:hypothetical protein